MNNNSPLIIEEIIAAPIDKVWQAITEKEKMKEWYFTIDDFILEMGAEFNFYEPGGKKQFHHRCQITDITPMVRFQHTWTHPGHSNGQTLVTWLLEPVNDSTKVILMHEGLENLEDAGKDFARENYEKGWKEIISISLKNYLERKA